MNKLGILYYSPQNMGFNRSPFKEMLQEKVLQEKFTYNAIFIMDNVNFHKVVEIKELIKNSDYEIL